MLELCAQLLWCELYDIKDLQNKRRVTSVFFRFYPVLIVTSFGIREETEGGGGVGANIWIRDDERLTRRHTKKKKKRVMSASSRLTVGL